MLHTSKCIRSHAVHIQMSMQALALLWGFLAVAVAVASSRALQSLDEVWLPCLIQYCVAVTIGRQFARALVLSMGYSVPTMSSVCHEFFNILSKLLAVASSRALQLRRGDNPFICTCTYIYIYIYEYMYVCIPKQGI